MHKSSLLIYLIFVVTFPFLLLTYELTLSSVRPSHFLKSRESVGLFKEPVIVLTFFWLVRRAMFGFFISWLFSTASVLAVLKTSDPSVSEPMWLSCLFHCGCPSWVVWSQSEHVTYTLPVVGSYSASHHSPNVMIHLGCLGRCIFCLQHQESVIFLVN